LQLQSNTHTKLPTKGRALPHLAYSEAVGQTLIRSNDYR